MSFRAAGVLFFSGLMAVIALSTGGRMYMLVALVLFVMFALSIISSLWAFLTLGADVSVSGEDIPRGESRTLRVTLKHSCPLPIAPVWAEIRAPSLDGNDREAVRIPARAFNPRSSAVRIHCPHVGRFTVGLTKLAVEDVFGLFSFHRSRPEWCVDTLVLPRVEPLDCPPFSPGESETELVSRATEDATSPSGVRDYQPGDEMKKIHWKLSLRKREILVKTFDQPLRPDAVVLLDCALPARSGLSHDARDRLCDIAASMCAALLSADAIVRMPLTGTPPEDVTLRKGDLLAPALRSIARMRFSGQTPFERVLALESARMRQSGTTVCVTGSLSPESADRVIRLRRLGPTVRVYLVADNPDERQRVLLQKLRQNDVECVVRQSASVSGAAVPRAGGKAL
ncbi:MAG: DUF58 domain-containing protein [Oscillospiraceae bacterium]|jgi:uncharacterized protein (DUF58 family)|nr:DUF58 domain-containing protein [Oscillospiraceae bacterium]